MEARVEGPTEPNVAGVAWVKEVSSAHVHASLDLSLRGRQAWDGGGRGGAGGGVGGRRGASRAVGKFA